MIKPPRQNDRDYGRYAAGLFASTVVLTCGAGACMAIALLSTRDVWRPAAVIMGGLAAVLLLLWMLSDRPLRRMSDANLYTVEKEKLDRYVESFHPRRRKRRRRHIDANGPPTADDLRRIKEDSNAWTPSERRADEYRRSLKQADE